MLYTKNVARSIEDAVCKGADSQTQACLNLWATVLRRGIADACKEHFEWKCKTRVSPTNFWMYHDDRCAPGSFLWLCGLFGLEADAVRSTVAANRRYFAKLEK